jgi:hypothetical protein
MNPASARTDVNFNYNVWRAATAAGRSLARSSISAVLGAYFASSCSPLAPTTLVEHHSRPGETLCQPVKDIILGGGAPSGDALMRILRLSPNLIVNPLGSVP